MSGLSNVPIAAVTPAATSYYCGIDIGKRKHMALFLDSTGHVVRPAFPILNTRDGFAQLVQELQNLNGAVAIAVEATGHYWLALYECLSSQGFDVVVLNPLQVHAYHRSGVRKCKNDRGDAFWIADFLRIAQPQPTSASLPTLLQLRELARFRYGLTAQLGDCKRKIVSVLDRVFPEYETLFSNVFLVTSQRLLQEAVTPEEFAEFDLSELSHLLQTFSRGRFQAPQAMAKAQAIQEAAHQTVGVSFLRTAIHVEMRCLLDQLQLLEAQREQVDEALAALMQKLPQWLTTIPGIGLATGATILAEIEDVQRFSSIEKLVAYTGIDACVYQSGEFEAKRMHMSKRGSPYLRCALWQAAHGAIQHDPELQAYYKRKRAEGKHHGTALGAVCRKLVGRIYVVLKEQRPYLVH
ncbi:MAG: IS110 family transposase [Abitibacteriaceae bacterium]|nr:IS110 family transposase [Abditibacteriaceae bacterium]